MKILIDNGHGAETPGKCSPDRKFREYRYCREIAAEVVRRLKEKGIDAELLVPETCDVSLARRIKRVNAQCARCGSRNVALVSIHNNAAGGDGKWHDARGFSVFVSKNSSEASRRIAVDFTDLAERRGLLGNRAVPQSRYWTWSWTQGDIAILRHTNCPAVLTENLFQDNREDVGFLLSASGREAIISLHVDAIAGWCSDNH